MEIAMHVAETHWEEGCLRILIYIIVFVVYCVEE